MTVVFQEILPCYKAEQATKWLTRHISTYLKCMYTWEKNKDSHGRMWKLSLLHCGLVLGSIYCVSCIYLEVICIVHFVWSFFFFLWKTLIVFSGCLELMRQMSSIKKQFKNMLLISMSSVNELI